MKKGIQQIYIEKQKEQMQDERRKRIIKKAIISFIVGYILACLILPVFDERFQLILGDIFSFHNMVVILSRLFFALSIVGGVYAKTEIEMFKTREKSPEEEKLDELIRSREGCLVTLFRFCFWVVGLIICCIVGLIFLIVELVKGLTKN